MGKTNVSARNTSRKGFRLSAALRDEPGGLQERFSEKTTAVHPGWTRGQSDLLRSRQGSLSLITNKSDERWGGFRRTAAGGRTRIPSKQASRAKLWIHGNLWGCWAEMAVRSLSLSLSFVIEWSRASNADARNLHPLRFCCWTTATVFFVSRNAGAARRHALLLLRPGLQLHAWPAV